MAKKKQKPIQKVLILLSGCAFLLSTVAFLFRSLSQSEPQASIPEEGSQEQVDPLASQEEGYEKVLEREPDNLFALQNLAEIRLARQNFSGAIEPIKKLHQLDPENSSVLQRLFQVQVQLNQPQDAIQTLEKLIAINPEQEEYKTLLATLQQQIENPNDLGNEQQEEASQE